MYLRMTKDLVLTYGGGDIQIGGFIDLIFNQMWKIKSLALGLFSFVMEL